jgi:heat shock protein HtpX
VHSHKNGLKTAALLGLLSAMILLVGAQFGSGGLLIALVVALGVNGYSYFYSDTLALKSMRAYPVSEVQAPRLYAVVAELAQTMRIPMPRLYLSPTTRPTPSPPAATRSTPPSA